jgi:hypothetical protein
METILITNDPEIALDAQEAGVSRIMVDLELTGKVERQASRNTFISKHSKEDIALVRRVLDKCPLIVRVNQWNDGSEVEIEHAIAAGADAIMLPMIQDIKHVHAFIGCIAGKAKPIPLIETIYSVEHLQQIATLPEIEFLYIGLNDLHLELKLNFLFEPLASGILDEMAGIIRAAGKEFGFGGIAAMGSGELPAERILAEHARLGSSCIILSSRFCRDVAITEAEGRIERLQNALGKLQDAYNKFRERNIEQQQEDSVLTTEMINIIANRLKASAQ